MLKPKYPHKDMIDILQMRNGIRLYGLWTCDADIKPMHDIVNALKFQRPFGKIKYVKTMGTQVPHQTYVPYYFLPMCDQNLREITANMIFDLFNYMRKAYNIDFGIAVGYYNLGMEIPMRLPQPAGVKLP